MKIQAILRKEQKTTVCKNTGITQIAELVSPCMRLRWWISSVIPESCKLLCFSSPYPTPALPPQAKTFTAWLQGPVASSTPHLLHNRLETHFPGTFMRKSV